MEAEGLLKRFKDGALMSGSRDGPLKLCTVKLLIPQYE